MIVPGTATKADIRPDLEHKTAVVAPDLLTADDETGVVEALVSITGIEDEVKDTIEPGAYAETMAARKPKGVFGHDWSKWTARTEEVKELLPGDPMLPKTQRTGQPWPAAAGAVYVKCRFNLDTDDGRTGSHNVKFFGPECEWSIGYQVPKGGATKTANGGRRIKKLHWYEYSPVLFGAAPLTGTLSVKTSINDGAAVADPEMGEQVVVDDGSGHPASDPVTEEAGSDDPDIAALHEDAMGEMDEAAYGWDAVTAAAAIDPGEEDLNAAVNAHDEDAGLAGQGSKIILDDGVTLEFTGAEPGEVKAKGSVRVSSKPWSDFKQSDYTPQQWHTACLIHDHAGGAPDSKDSCKLPVREPSGTLNRNGVHAAAAAIAGARGGVQASADAKAKAKSALRGMYRTIGDDPPESLAESKVAGQEATPADVRAADRLKHWYTHGGGAAEIGWGSSGDFMRCVAIASKHMQPDQAKGFCQLRHHDATGAYAGHAPAELAERAAEGKKDAEDGGGETKAGGYDPALEAGPDGGTADPWASGGPDAQVKTGQLPGVPGSLEQHVDQVAAAVTEALAVKQTLAGGMPRYLVVVGGTWPDHAIATRFDLASKDLDGAAFQVPYTVGEGGAIQAGDPEPVTLTVADEDTAGTKDAAEDELSGIPVLVEHVTGFIRRGVSLKAGRVLSEINIKLLRGAVDQLISVLNNAGIPIDVPGNDVNTNETIEAGSQGTDPLYLPDSTAPAAQVMSGKTLLEPGLVARAYAITAAAHCGDGEEG